MLYKNRDEIRSVVHCHSEWASILSCQRKDILQFHYMVAEFGGKTSSAQNMQRLVQKS